MTLHICMNHKFGNTNDVNLDQLKFRPIMDETGTYTCNVAKVISNYLRTLCITISLMKNLNWLSDGRHET